jgi:hypothetical protein
MDNQQQKNNNQSINPFLQKMMQNPRGRQSRARSMATSAAKSAAKKVTKEGAKKVATAIMSNPYVLAGAAIAIGSFALILIIIASIINACESYWDDPIGNAPLAFIGNATGLCNIPDLPEAKVPPPPVGVNITKTGPSSIVNGGTINYSIQVTYDSSLATVPADNMILVDLPEYDFDPSSTTSNPTAAANGITYTWKLTDLPSAPTGDTITTYTAQIAIKPTVLDNYVLNSAYIVAPTGTTPTLSCSSGDYRACLKEQFNVTVVGPAENEDLQFIYNTLSIPLSHSIYLRLFKSLSVTITISSLGDSNGSAKGGAWATTNWTTGNMVIYQNLLNARQSTRQQYLIHESAHSIAATREGSRLQDSLYLNVYIKGLDSGCFKAGPLIKTFPFDSAYNYDHEVFAESVADSLVCSSGESCGDWGGGSINDFPTTCSNTYNFVQSKILGL